MGAESLFKNVTNRATSLLIPPLKKEVRGFIGTDDKDDKKKRRAAKIKNGTILENTAIDNQIGL